MTYNPLTRIYRLEDDTSVNYLMACTHPLSRPREGRAMGLPPRSRCRRRRCCSTSTARSPTRRAISRARSTGCAPIAGSRRCPCESLRAHASSGARGLLGAGLGIAPDHADYPALRDAFLAYYEQELAVTTRLFDGVRRSSTRSTRAACAGAW
jgi:hypothetical protein